MCTLVLVWERPEVLGIVELELQTDSSDLPDMGGGVEPGSSGRADCALNPSAISPACVSLESY